MVVSKSESDIKMQFDTRMGICVLSPRSSMLKAVAPQGDS